MKKAVKGTIMVMFILSFIFSGVVLGFMVGWLIRTKGARTEA